MKWLLILYMYHAGVAVQVPVQYATDKACLVAAYDAYQGTLRTFKWNGPYGVEAIACIPVRQK